MSIFKEIIFWFGCFCAFCALFTVFSFLIFSVKDRKKSKPIMSDWEASSWQKNGAAKIRKMIVILLMLSGTSYAQDCGYTYTYDTTGYSLIDSTCTASTTRESYPCYVGRWPFRRKTVCYRDVTNRACIYDTSYHVTVDSTAILCPDTNSVKDHLSGLMLRQQNWFNDETPDTAWLNAFGGNIVLRIYLKDIWTARHTFNFTPISDWLLFGDQMAAIGVPIHYKLRIIPGVFVAQWMRDSCGAFPLTSAGFETTPGSDVADDSCVKFWSDTYLRLWAELQDTLAAHYDTSRYINEVTITGTAVGTGEPFEWGTGGNGDGLTRRNQFIAAGATVVNTKAAIYSTVDAYSAWHYTNIGFCLSPFQSVNPAAAAETNTTKLIGEYMAAIFTTRAVLGNNGLRLPSSPDGQKWTPPNGIMYKMQLFYQQMRDIYGSKIYNQTASALQMGGYDKTAAVLDAGVNFGDILIELPGLEANIKATLTNEQLRYYRDLCKMNN